MLERAFGWRNLAILLTLVIIGLIALSGWFAIERVAGSAVAERMEAEALRSSLAQQRLAERGTERALATGRVVAGLPWVRALARGGANAPSEIDDLLRQLSRELGFDGFRMLRSGGEQAAAWGRLEAGGSGELMARIVALGLEVPTALTIELDGAAVPVVVVPLEEDFDILGTALLSHAPVTPAELDEAVAGQAAFLSRSGAVLGGSGALELPERAAALVLGLNAPTTMHDGAGEWVITLAPAPGKLEANDVVMAHIVRRGPAIAPFRWLQWGSAALGVLCIGLALGLVRMRPGRGAVDELAQALDSLSRGKSARIDGVALEQLGKAGVAFNRLGAAATRRERLEQLAASASSAAALQALKPSATDSSAADAQPGVLCESCAMLGVEIRRFANPKIRERPQEDAARASAQLDALAEISGSLGGELLFAAGLRAVVSFRGPEGAARAALAACRLRRLFSVPDDPYRDAMPPLCVLVDDTLVRGPWRTTGSAMALGPGLQQMQPLLLEAVPGEILMTEAFHTKVIETVPALDGGAPARRALLTRLRLREVTDASEAALVSWAEDNGVELEDRQRWLGRERSIRHLTELSGNLGVHTLARVGAVHVVAVHMY